MNFVTLNAVSTNTQKQVITMKKLIESFPDQIREAVQIAENAVLRNHPNNIKNVVICGMGGSGIGGLIVHQWIRSEISVPVILVQDYSIPAFVDIHTLVIGSSYSGNTEETLIALEEAREKGALIAGICSGGKLHEFCIAHGYDCILVRGGFPPRAATGYSIVQLLKLLEFYGVIRPGRIEQVLHSATYLETKSDELHLLGKQIAEAMYGKVGVIYSGPEYECVVTRTRQQFNENSKFLCLTHIIPEMNHNELVGWEGGDDRFSVLFIDGEDISSRNKVRMEITRELIGRKTKNIHSAKASGSSHVERCLYLIHLVDWASYYLHELNGVDILDIKVIDHLKSELSKI
jgi:glucose/mannose-6-phosphate isomerase